MRFLITGGARGIGAQIVRDVCEAGHHVAFTYLRSETEAQAVVDRVRARRPEAVCLPFRLDVRDAAGQSVCV